MKKILALVFLLPIMASCSIKNSSSQENSSWATNNTSQTQTKTPTNTGEKIDLSQDTAMYDGIQTTTYGTGKVILEAFGDFQCPACIAMHKMIEPVFIEYAKAGKIQIQYKQFPLTKMHPNAYRDALAALCAAEQGQYGNYADALYTLEKKKSGAKVTDADRIALAKNMNADIFKKCLESDQTKSQLDADMKYGEKMNISGTPTYVLNGTKIDMRAVRDINGLKKLLDAKIAE